MKSKIRVPEHHRLGVQKEGLLQFIKRCNNPETVVQIGVAIGDDTELWLETTPNTTIYSVDPWCCERFHKNYGEVGYKTFIERFKDFKNVIPVRLSSVDASKVFPDCFFDVVYIDAMHDYENNSQDITLWISKVKEGGIIGGHDYCDLWPGVIKAVDEKFGKDNIEWFKDSSWLVKL